MKRFLLPAMICVVPALAQSARIDLGRIEGRVIDTNGRPIRKATVVLIGPTGGAAAVPASADTDADGKFSLDGIEPGMYSVRADRAGYLGNRYRTSPHEMFGSFSLNAAEDKTGVTIVLAREASISGRVLDQDGDPVASASVRVHRPTFQFDGPDMTVERYVSTDESGTYKLTGLAASQYYLSADSNSSNTRIFSVIGMRAGVALGSGSPSSPAHPPEFYTLTFYPSAKDRHAAMPIQVVAGQDLQGVDIRIQKTPAFLVHSKVTGSVPGHPLDQCRVALQADNLPPIRSGFGPGNGGGEALEKDGSANFRGQHFPPGEYSILLTCGPLGRTLQAQRRFTIRDRDIDADVNLQPLLELQGSISIDGKEHADFATVNGPTAPRTQIGLYVLNSSLQTDIIGEVKDDGSFTIPNIAPGEYGVRVTPVPGSTYVKSMRLGLEEGRDGVIQVTRESAANPFQITVSGSLPRIEGMVESAQAQFVGSAITLFGEAGTRPGLAMMSGVGSNGHFSLPVAPGTYRIYAWEDLDTAQRYDPGLLKAYEAQSTVVTVAETGSVQVTVKEIPAGPEFRR